MTDNVFVYKCSNVGLATFTDAVGRHTRVNNITHQIKLNFTIITSNQFNKRMVNLKA